MDAWSADTPILQPHLDVKVLVGFYLKMKKTIQKALNGIKKWQIEENTNAKKITLITIGVEPLATIAAIKLLLPANWSVEWKEGFEVDFQQAMKPKRGLKVSRAS